MGRLTIGLTGGIGSGKSAAADRFADHGIDIVDADLASRAVVEPGQPALAEIAAHFGADILQTDGGLDRAKLRHTVFASVPERKWLQALLHPLINDYIRHHLDTAQSAYAILVNPLLIETRQNAWCDRVLVVDVPRDLQIDRTMARDANSREQVERILDAQLSRSDRVAHADDVITNDLELSHLHRQVDELHSVYLELCQKQRA
jgi:dephospho-CoA kinase